VLASGLAAVVLLCLLTVCLIAHALVFLEVKLSPAVLLVCLFQLFVGVACHGDLPS
jgi:hypothetical protein